ncbi:hypothetical protein [Nostoc parmelioides]|uniref:Uncharacterized protein n=1 Tax=Nostoc parmelioides FACHB-3921 TaxID=2692909 RepID=A0ABR8BNM4_9NOSO|nr:hypothetical protein [Nostoc parmelioides]MBD2255436.1 hypothetical protein [Nostoc parmelioides FACHB-3921]
MGSGKDSLQLAKTKTRLLLALWDLGGTQQEVKKRQISDKMKSKGKNITGYPGILEELQKDGAITISKQGYSLTSPKGLEVLGESLRSSEFKFEGTIVGTWAANALVKWISQIDVAVVKTSVPVNGKGAIASYEEFKSVVLEVYDKLNQNYNLNDLVPIYRIRREIGDRVSRDNFHEWLLEVQANDIFQLIAGEIPDFTSDKREDSITIPGVGLRSYAKRLS